MYAPPEMINFMASSTSNSISIMSSGFRYKRKPEVGLGVVGTNTATRSLSRLRYTIPRSLEVTKATT